MSDIDTLHNNVRFGVVDVSSAGNCTVIPAVAGKRIRVLTYLIEAKSPVTIWWASEGAPISGRFYMRTHELLRDSSRSGVFETGKSEGLCLDLSKPVAVSGHLAYILI